MSSKPNENLNSEEERENVIDSDSDDEQDEEVQYKEMQDEEQYENVEDELEESSSADSDGEQTLQLGDVIIIKSPDNEIYNDNTFIIDYIDEEHVKLINTSDLQQRNLQIKNGILGDGSITGINLIYRNKEKGYARQNGLIPGRWVNIYFGGEFPAIITGKITNLESDMIEITMTDNDVIYLNFAYKGIPEDLPIETIELREEPETFKEKERKEESQKRQTENYENEEELEAEPEAERFEQLEEYSEEDEEESLKFRIPVKEVADQAKEFIIFADELEFGNVLGPIQQFVEVDEIKQRYNIDYQTNDLLDELLSDIPSVERTTRVLSNIHTMIERFKQLRTSFSNFDDYGNVISAFKKDALWKPLVKNLEKMKTSLYWLLPVAKNRKKLYDIKYDENELENQSMIEINLTDDIKNIQGIMRNFKSGATGDEQNKYVNLFSDLNPYFTPFDDINPEFVNDIINDQEVSTDLNVVIDNLGDFYSSVAKNDDIKTRRFLIQKYNLGLSRLEATNFKGSKMISHRVSLTKPDVISLKSIITLPEPTIVFSQISLPSSSIMQKANLNLSFLNYWEILKKSTKIENINIDDFEKEYEFQEDNYASNIKNYVLVEKDNNISSYENYVKFLNVVIPKTRVLFNLVKKYIKGKLSLKDVVSFMEPFLIYTDDLTYMQYKEINSFIQEKMIEYKKSFVEKSRTFNIIKSINDKLTTGSSCKEIKDLLGTNLAIKKEVLDSYDDKIMDAEMTNTELLRRFLLRDFSNLYNIAISLENIVLMLPNNVSKFLEDESETIKDEIKSAEENNTCKKYIVAKQYASISDLEADNGKIIYFDKRFDKINYGILDDYEKEQISLVPEDFERFLIDKLVSKHNYNIDEAPYIADALINGVRNVSNGDLALVYLNDESDYKYYVRDNNKWVEKEDLTDSNIVSTDTNVLCNLQADCIEVDKKLKANCESYDLNKTELSETALKQMISAFDKKYQVSKDEQQTKIKKKFDYLLGIMEELTNIEKMRIYKYNKEHYELGANNESEDAVITSPYIKLRDAILGIEDFVKKQVNIVKFCKRFAREPNNEEERSEPKNSHWLYCIKTNTQLIPLFYFTLASAYLVSQDEYQEQMAIVIKNIGKLSDDGDMWVDENSGFPIKAIDYDVEEGYESSGFKTKTRDIMEEDIGENILKSNENANAIANVKRIETRESKIISNIVTFLGGSMGINIIDKREFIIKIVTDALRVALTSEAEYNKKVQEMAKKGKKLPTYKETYNLTILYLTLSAFLIAVQTSIPSIKTRKTYPGCVRSFDGYPIEGKTGDLSGITYIACIAEKSKSAVEPWTALKGSKMDKIRDKIMAFTDNYMLKHSDVIRKFEEKTEFLLSKPGDFIPEEYNLLKWNNFLPPLIPFKIKSSMLENVSSQFKKLLLDDLKSGSQGQREKLLVLQSKIIYFSLAIQEKIQGIVKEKETKLLLTNSLNEPFLENSCCNEKTEKSTIQYFESADPDIKRFNDVVKEMENLLYDINAVTSSPFFLSRENTKNIYPPLTDQYNEETIYLAFIKYCRFNSLIPMNEDLLSICSDKPEAGFLTINDSISEKIRKLKQTGRDFNSEKLIRLMQIVERHNIIDININKIVDKPMQILRDILEKISLDEENIIPDTLLDNINGILDSYDLTVEEDTQEMKSLKNYLARSNEQMKNGIIDFIKENANLSKTNMKNMREIINDIMNWEAMNEKLEGDKMSKVISDSIKYNSIQFVKEFMKDIINVFPNIILNQVDYTSVVIQDYLHLSSGHEKDISTFIRDYYSGLRPFYDDKKLQNILSNIQNKCNSLLSLAIETPAFTEITYNGRMVYSIFDKRTTLLLFENYLLQTLMQYINLSNDENMINLQLSNYGESMLNENASLDQLNTVEGLDFYEQKLEPREIKSDVIISGNIADLKERTAKLLIAFLNIMSERKSLVDMSYENIMDILFKTKEKEKDTFTDRLKKLNDEERDVEKMLKKNKLGDWNKGLKKGLTQYVAEDYDDEREEMDKLIEVERSVRKNKYVSDNNVDQFMEDFMEEDRVDKEIENEDNDLSGLKGEGDDSDFEVDQDDQEDNQWGGWEPYEE
jgi:hypothetical protein